MSVWHTPINVHVVRFFKVVKIRTSFFKNDKNDRDNLMNVEGSYARKQINKWYARFAKSRRVLFRVVEL